jgi:tetratricopeptide (TPR) repeat protein
MPKWFIAKHLRLWLLASAAALGGAGLGAGITLGNAPLTSEAPSLPPGMTEADFILCHTPSKAGFGAGLLRLAATQTEVPATGMQAASPSPDFANTYPPLWDGLGTRSYKITTNEPQAQAYFNQGLLLAYGFNHDEARRAFREAQRRDPECAMCFWGEALVLGPNINMPFAEEAIAPAYAAVQKAQALAASNTKNPVTGRERALITALATRYSPDPKAERAVLDAAYAAAMAEASKLFPDDNDIAVLFAEAVMDLSPWDYWKPGGAEPNPQSAPIVPTLERVLAREPNHPGALHYYIHAVEASDRPWRAEAAADRLRGALPGAGHMVHMPSHIYYRIGRYFDALAVNKDAAAADENYLKASDAPMGVYRLGYYPHNVHFILASATMSGDGPRRSRPPRSSPRSFRTTGWKRLPAHRPSNRRSISRTPSSARPTPSWRCRIRAAPDPTSARCGTTRAASPRPARAISAPPRRKQTRSPRWPGPATLTR